MLVRIEAAPINPSDIGAMLGSADPASARVVGSGSQIAVEADLRGEPTVVVLRRVGLPMPMGNEGAGTVVDAAADCAWLIGRKVGMLGGAMFAQYRRLSASDCLVLPEGMSAEEGAALFVNPLTALAMAETARRENHRAVVHTAAASNLGRMLGRICRMDGIPLVNLVRSHAQKDFLLGEGEKHVVDTSSARFMPELTEALVATGATIAFDAVGGGGLGSSILEAMEAAAVQTSGSLNSYGSNVFKQVYVYGSLDPSPTVLERRYGLTWGIGGFLMTTALQRIGADGVDAMKRRVLAEATSTFASRYVARIGLDELLAPDTLAKIARRATGEKYLLTPQAGA